jgi:hypothetical protein
VALADRRLPLWVLHTDCLTEGVGSQTLKAAAAPVLPEPPALPDYGTHKVCDFLNFTVRSLRCVPSPVRVGYALRFE